MDKQLIINELHRKKDECENNHLLSPVDVVDDIIDFVNKCPDEETDDKKVNKWLPKREYLDTLFKIYSTRRLDLYDKQVVLDIYNNFLDLLGEPRGDCL
jgi:transcription elongation factor Elf1